MSGIIEVHRNRDKTFTVRLNRDVTGSTFTSQVRSQSRVDAPLLMTWDVTVTDVATGTLTVSASSTITGQVSADSGYTDIKEVNGSQSLPVFKEPLQVIFVGTVTE